MVCVEGVGRKRDVVDRAGGSGQWTGVIGQNERCCGLCLMNSRSLTRCAGFGMTGFRWDALLVRTPSLPSEPSTPGHPERASATRDLLFSKTPHVSAGMHLQARSRVMYPRADARGFTARSAGAA